MKAPRKLLIVVCAMLYLAMLTAVASAAPPTALKPSTGIVAQKPLPLVDNPIIHSFNSYPFSVAQGVVQGADFSLSWNVTPGPGSSPISSVTISVDGSSIFSNPSQNSSHTRPFVWVGEKTFILTARNAAGNTSTLSKAVRGISISEAMSKITIMNMDANPQRFLPGQPIDFKVTINNANTGIPIHQVNIFITQGSRVVANLTNTSLIPGAFVRTLQDSGFTATGGYYTVDLEYKGQHKTKTFMTKPVTMYTIDPAP